MTYTPADTAGAFAPDPPTPSAAPRPRSTAGAGGVLLGVAALAFAWVPVVGLVMVIPAVAAVVLGVAGFAGGRSRRGLPALAVFLGLATLVVAPAGTAVGALLAGPWLVGVAGDATQANLERELARNGLDRNRADRIAGAVGDAVRDHAAPAEWRDGIDLAHRVGLAVEDYERAERRLAPGDVVGRMVALRTLNGDLSRTADRHGVALSPTDVQDLTLALGTARERRSSAAACPAFSDPDCRR